MSHHEKLWEIKEAELAARKGIEINPDYALATKLGTILKDLGKL